MITVTIVMTRMINNSAFYSFIRIHYEIGLFKKIGNTDLHQLETKDLQTVKE